jgi:hypothetical protein
VTDSEIEMEKNDDGWEIIYCKEIRTIYKLDKDQTEKSTDRVTQ